ncbi:hypothetical protein AND_009825 [Anopheles darlingi]|uniref:Uncharacterized protein n=1 Tax=Anopheles darlingi TaxID=43151 RepID=W5J2R8_ANODA|nr:hypothetical protein AND_009825 [Anopheles darlingi]
MTKTASPTTKAMDSAGKKAVKPVKEKRSIAPFPSDRTRRPTNDIMKLLNLLNHCDYPQAGRRVGVEVRPLPRARFPRESAWYPNERTGDSGGVSVVYDGGGSGGSYYGNENVSFYGPQSMVMEGGYPKKRNPVYDVNSSGYCSGGSVPYEYPPQGMMPQQYQPSVLYNQSQMLTAVAPAMAGNNDYQHQQQHPATMPPAGSVAYQPFYPVPQPPPGPPPQVPMMAPTYHERRQTTDSSDDMLGGSQPNLSSTGAGTFLEQPYLSASYAPCQGPPPWNYAHCYGYYGQDACPYVNMVDMEDFMNNEKRKEKSRDAARCRRSRETEIFQDLASLLPMAQEEVDHLDKASVMRLSIAYLRARNMLELYDFPQKNEKMEIKQDEDVSMEATTADVDRKLDLKALGLEPEMVPLQALDGFLLVLSVDGDVTYVSENVSDYLGIAQIDIMGQPIWEYSHQCDHDELREALNGRHHSPSELLNGVANSECRPLENRDFFLRLKCTLTSRGRSVNIRSASYKVLHVTGHIACKDKEGQRQLVSIARPLPHPANIEVPLGSSTFLSKHTLGMKFSYVDDK